MTTKQQLEELLKTLGRADEPTEPIFLKVAETLQLPESMAPSTFSQFKVFLVVGAWESAAITLCEAVLPGWNRMTQTHQGHPTFCILTASNSPQRGVGRHKSEALSILEAMLNALIAQTTDNGDQE